ncbi:MAG: hypothetical protein ACI89J_004318 [Hyphomicrobiaceae bacterium]|jgi:hypothetical protein
MARVTAKTMTKPRAKSAPKAKAKTTTTPKPVVPKVESGLTCKQETFAVELVKSGDASASYRKAYNAGKMKPETINVKACELLKNGKVTVRVAELQAEWAEIAKIEFDMDARKLFEMLTCSATYDTSIYFHDDGTSKAQSEIPEQYRRLMEPKITASGKVRLLPPSRETAIAHLGKALDMTNTLKVKSNVKMQITEDSITEGMSEVDVMRTFEDFRRQVN